MQKKREYRFYAKLKNGAKIDTEKDRLEYGVMELYVEGQETPVYNLRFSGNLGCPDSLLLTLFQYYILDNLPKRRKRQDFGEVRSWKVRRALKRYLKEAMTLGNKHRTFVFVPDKISTWRKLPPVLEARLRLS